jgi:hypothetical protein
MKTGIAFFLISTNILAFGGFFLFVSIIIPFPGSGGMELRGVGFYFLAWTMFCIGAPLLGSAIWNLISGSDYLEHIRKTYGNILVMVGGIALTFFILFLLIGGFFARFVLTAVCFSGSLALLIPGTYLVRGKNSTESIMDIILEDARGEVW